MTASKPAAKIGRQTDPQATARSDAGGRFVVDGIASGMRLDHFVGRCVGLSTAAARKLIDEGLIRIVGQATGAKGTRLTKGSVVEVAPRPFSAPGVLPDATWAVVVVYEDDDLVAIDKPAGVPSHPLRPGERGTAANAIVARFPSCAGASPDPREGGLGHRLDTATSGVLIAARSPGVWTALRGALGADDCEKRYLCEVWGAPPDVGRIDVDIGRRGRRGRTVSIGGGRRPRSAETEWKVVARATRTALLEARLHSGKPHQVRAHLASAGFPIVGDDRYGGLEERASAASAPSASAVGDEPGLAPGTRLHLHASAVRFRHPVTGALLTIEAPPPPWATGPFRS